MRQSRGGKESITRGEKMIEMAKKNLEDVAAYKFNIVGVGGGLVADSANTSYRIQSSSVDYSNTFNEDDPLSWAVDQNKLDDIESERS